MRKLAGVFVLASLTFLILGKAAALRAQQTSRYAVRIVASLEEVTGPAAGPAVLLFFSLDCPVCWEELFEVRYIVEKHSIPINFVGISADSREDLEPFLAKHAFFYPIISDPGRQLFRRFDVRLEPFAVVLDGGRVIFRDNTAQNRELRREKLRRCLLEIYVKPLS